MNKISIIGIIYLLILSPFIFSQTLIGDVKKCQVLKIKDIGTAYAISLACPCYKTENKHIDNEINRNSEKIKQKDDLDNFLLQLGYFDTSNNNHIYTIISLKTKSLDALPIIVESKSYNFKFSNLKYFLSFDQEVHWIFSINKETVLFKYEDYYRYGFNTFVLSPCIEGLYYKGCGNVSD